MLIFLIGCGFISNPLPYFKKIDNLFNNLKNFLLEGIFVKKIVRAKHQK
jgi:hypothetical protein